VSCYLGFQAGCKKYYLDVSRFTVPKSELMKLPIIYTGELFSHSKNGLDNIKAETRYVPKFRRYSVDYVSFVSIRGSFILGKLSAS